MFTAVIEGELLGVSEQDMRDGGKLKTYLVVNETDVLKLYGASGEDQQALYDQAGAIKRPAHVRVQIHLFQDSNGKLKARPLAIQAA